MSSRDDMLVRIFEHQKTLQKELGAMPESMNLQYIKDMVLASIVELTEILNETAWKPWKKQQNTNKEKFQEEIADLLHFVINLCIVADIKPEQLYKLYLDKNKRNRVRHKEGY